MVTLINALKLIYFNVETRKTRESLLSHIVVVFNLTFDEYNNTLLYVLCLTPYSILLEMTDKLFMYVTLG